MSSEKKTRVVCLKTTELRAKEGIDNVKEWLAQPSNVYVGRSQRIFIHTGKVYQDGMIMAAGSYLDKHNRVVERFTLPESPWHNRFKVDKTKSAQEEHRRVVSLYREDLLDRMESDKSVKCALLELRGMNLGCWCVPPLPCHAAALAEIIDSIDAVRL